MEFMKQKWSAGLVVSLLFAAFVIGGCAKGDKGSISTSVSDPSAATFRPVGTIQGKIRDAVTLQPIVNAVVSIGLAIDVTDAQGQYILANVPATSDALNGTVSGAYDITVDLRAVVSPLDMRVATTTPRYPDFRYQDVSVNFTSLNDSNPCTDGTNPDPSGGTSCGTNNTNHDTPVDGLAANADVNVGKLAANIQGVVAGCSVANGDFFTPVGAGYTVNLINNSSSVENTGSGALGRVVATATTNASGAFTFNNIEANRSFQVEAVDSVTNPTRIGRADGDPIAGGQQPVTSPSDGQTLFLRVQESTAVHVCLIDNHAPAIIAVSPEPGSDQTAGATTVTITFSEPIKQEAASSTVPSTAGLTNLYDKIIVNFDGNKAGNIPYTLAWNATFDQLTVGFTTGASALYVVKLPTVSTLRDVDNNTAVVGVCPTASISPWVTTGVAGDCVVYFSTNGGPTPGTTTALTLVNASSLDFGVTTGIFDWPIISGAKTYKLYCQRLQVYQDGSSQVDSDFLLMPTGILFTSSTNFSFAGFPVVGGFLGTGNEHALKYDCKVRGVNSDGAEGADSNIVRGEDKIGPTITGTAPSGSQILVTFNEAVRESDAETLANYSLVHTGAPAAPALSTAVLCSAAGVPVAACTAANQVVLTYGGALTIDGANTLTVNTTPGVKDIAGNTNRTPASTPPGVNTATF